MDYGTVSVRYTCSIRTLTRELAIPPESVDGSMPLTLNSLNERTWRSVARFQSERRWQPVADHVRSTPYFYPDSVGISRLHTRQV